MESITNKDKVFAFGHDTISTANLFDFLKDYFQQESVEGIVVGLPKRLHNQPSSISADVMRLLKSASPGFPNFKSIPTTKDLHPKLPHTKSRGLAQKNNSEKTNN